MTKLFERATHAGQLERWLGKAGVEQVSEAMRGWYGPPVALGGVPGRVFAHRGGDFRGRITTGLEASALNVGWDLLRRLKRGIRDVADPNRLNAITSLSGLIAARTAGQAVSWRFAKNGATGVVAVTNTLFGLGAQPAAGGAGGAAPGGTALTDASTGGNPYTNPTSGTLHLTGASGIASVAGNSLLLYDRLFQVAKTMNSTATEAVTGVPTRYQSTTGGAADSAEGNFLAIEVGGTALAATAHNWTVCQYTDQGGTTAVNLPSVTGNSGAIVRRLDQPVGTWFCPLASGDTGIKALTQMQCSAAVATGLIDFMMGHPLMWIPCPLANTVCQVDGVTTAFNLVRVFDDACLALLEVAKPSTTATNYNVQVDAVWG